MSLDLCASTRAWIARSASRRELVEFGDWLEGAVQRVSGRKRYGRMAP